MPVLGVAGAGDLAGGGLQRGEQRGGAVPDVIVAALFRDAGPHGQHRRLAFQRLRLGLFIDAQHHGLVRRVEVQADDVADLGFQLRVGGELEALRAPRLQSTPATRPRP